VQPVREGGVERGDWKPGLAQLPGSAAGVLGRARRWVARGDVAGGGEVADEGGGEVAALVRLGGEGPAGHGVAARGVAGPQEDKGVEGGGGAKGQGGGEVPDGVEDGVGAREVGVGDGGDAGIGKEAQDALVLLRPGAQGVVRGIELAAVREGHGRFSTISVDQYDGCIWARGQDYLDVANAARGFSTQ
jgi:hypothetical protein